MARAIGPQPRRPGAAGALLGGLLAALLLVVAARPLLGATSNPERSRALLLTALRYADRGFDERAPLRGGRSVRGSSWHALGLLQRGEPGDRERAVALLRAVIGQQMNVPGKPWHGTYFRVAGEAPPQDGAKDFKEYDPNWREFIGTTFALCLINHAAELPADLCARLQESIVMAVEGELAQKRLSPGYTNIALMHGFLWGFAGQRAQRPDWVKGAEAWAEEVNRLYREHNAFEEYNSPTYYGVDLYGLALWRRHGATPRMRALGAALEASLWRDIAAFYHAGLKNLCGPYDRAYGMDLSRYVSLVGVWLGLVLEPELVPLPALDGPLEHGGDLLAAPTYTALGAEIPDDALAAFRQFSGERALTRPISGPRVATTWIGRDLMIGAEATGLTRGTDTKKQLHAATVHWRAPGAAVGWLVLRRSPAVDARAEKNLLTVATLPGETVFEVSAPGVTAAAVARGEWSLPGLSVTVESDAKEFDAQTVGRFVEIHYRGATRFALHLHHEP